MEDLAKYYTANMTEAEKSALVKFQSRINEAGEIEPEKTAIQTAPVVKFRYENDMPIDTYHNGNEEFSGIQFKQILSSGKLKACTTPLHLKRYMDKPTEPNQVLNTGSAFHSLILEPEKFEYELFDDTQIIADLQAEGYTNARATKKYKEWFSQYADENGDLRLNVLKKDAFQTMWRLKKKLMKDQAVKTLFASSMSEVSIFIEFDHPIAQGGNLMVKVRPDGLKVAGKADADTFGRYGIKEGDLIIISVKTTLDASPDGFIRQAMKMQYDLSEAFYSDVIASVYPEKNIHTIFLTLEKDGQVFTGHYLLRYCSQDFLQRGREKYQANLELYCNSKDLTEGYQLATGSTIVMI